MKVLGRGYAIPRREGGALVKSVEELSPGQGLSLEMRDGKVSCRVEDVLPETSVKN